MAFNIYPIVFNTIFSVLGEPQSVTILRRPQTVGDDGFITTDGTQEFLINAVVVPIPPNTLDRRPEYQTTFDTIEVTTDSPLYGPVRTTDPADYQPDLVIWHGGTYMVTSVLDYTKLGTGFVKAICQAVDSVSGPPMEL